MGIFFESDAEKLARRIKNIENYDKPIKFHEWFIPFSIVILLPIALTITIIIYKHPSIEEYYNLGKMLLVIIPLTISGIYLYSKYGSRCSW